MDDWKLQTAPVVRLKETNYRFVLFIVCFVDFIQTSALSGSENQLLKYGSE